MAFSSISDARTKLSNPETAEDSQILYANNNLLDSTTIFYTNTAKTILASAGNYVIPTQYKTYYVTLGSDGKISGSKTELIEASADSSWVDDYIAEYSSGSFIPNDNFSSGNVGTNLSINATTYLVTDAYWSSRSYAHSKKWVIDQGEIVSTALTNIDVSAMKGYDLRLMTGEWYQNTQGGSTTAGFLSGNTISAIIHIKQDINRVLISDKVNYYFRPDYFIPLYSAEYPSFLKRLPNCLPIADRYGRNKEFMTKQAFLFDFIEKGSGSDGVSKRTYRNQTAKNKGYSLVNVGYFKDTFYGVPSNSNYYMTYDSPHDPTDNIYTLTDYANYHIFDYDSWIRGAVQFVLGRTIDTGVTDTSYCVAMLQSLLITDSGDRSTWVFNNGIITISYATINPYQWTTVPGVGTNYIDQSPANRMLQMFNPNTDANSARNRAHGKHIQFDFEYVAGAGRNDLLAGQSTYSIWNNCKSYSIAQNWSAIGGVIPTFSNYAEGIYTVGLEGSGTAGWRYVAPSESIATVKSTDLYKDYKEYFIDGTRSKSLMTNYHAFYEGAINCYSIFFVTDYLKAVVNKWYFYNAVHSYDISKKLIQQILGTEGAKDKKVCGYSWQQMENIGGSDFGSERKGYLSGTGFINYRPNNPPSHNQSLAVWSFAYMDGLYIWGNNEAQGGEFNKYNAEFTSGAYRFGDLRIIDNGAYDWYHIGYWQVMQNKDIVGADTPWLKPELKIDSTTWTSNTDADTSNYPVMLYNQQRPISAYKVSADGTEALLIMTSPFNNGYTKETFTVRLPAKSNQQFDIDVWGNYTTVVRLKGL
jgi:hypothetical protein